MKIFHISDLHLGKQLHGYDLIEDQREMFAWLLIKLKEERPDVLLIAGDIYDRSIPSGDAMKLFDVFLSEISKLQPVLPVLIIAGNHDSASRLSYGKSFMQSHHIHIATLPPQEEGETLEKVVIEDAIGEVYFYLLPFTRPGMVRHFMSQAADGYQAVVKALLDKEGIDWTKRNVLVAHQFFVAGGVMPEICDSEQANLIVGGLDAIDVSVVEKFDYVALGHIHGQQFVGKEHIRYCGTPLKYSVSEANHKKSVSVVEIGEKAEGIVISKIPFQCKHDVCKRKGTMKELIQAAQGSPITDYVSLVLTDEIVPENPRDFLEAYYPRILELHIENSRTSLQLQEIEQEDNNFTALKPLEAFSAFFQEMNGREMKQEELVLLQEIVEGIEEREGDY